MIVVTKLPMVRKQVRKRKVMGKMKGSQPLFLRVTATSVQRPIGWLGIDLALVLYKRT